MEKILKIEKVENINMKSISIEGDGYLITTSKQQITFLIDNCQNCCENWGYITSEDPINRFIGSELLEISTTDKSLRTYKYNNHDNNDNDWIYNKAETLFINVNTSVGLLQFVLYNDHNGYYGHHVEIKSEQLTITDYL